MCVGFLEDCGSRLIDVRRFVCCSGRVFKRIDNAECCYGDGNNVTVYNSNNQVG